jgi:hypothetical protein
MPDFTLNQRAIYHSDGGGYRIPGTVRDNLFYPDEGNVLGISSPLSLDKVQPIPDAAFEVGDVVEFNNKTGTVSKVDEKFIYVDDCYVFNRDGTSAWPCYHAGVTAPSSKLERGWEWVPTPGREYPEKPRIVYGVFDGYDGQPIEPGTSNSAMIGWAVLGYPLGQIIYDTEVDALNSGVLDKAIKKWQDKCFYIDLAAIDNPFDILLGLELCKAWLYMDSFGVETLGECNVISFDYSRVCAVGGLMTRDEITNFFNENYGSMKVTAVDGTKITINETSFHVLPRLVEDFKPTISTNNPRAALKNLAMRLSERDSVTQMAA